MKQYNTIKKREYNKFSDKTNRQINPIEEARKIVRSKGVSPKLEVVRKLLNIIGAQDRKIGAQDRKIEYHASGRAAADERYRYLLDDNCG